jgi:hypothetical protein
MAGQEQIKRDRRDDGPDDLPELGASAPAGQTHDVDDLLDEIDGSWSPTPRSSSRVSSRRAASDLATRRRSPPAAYLTSGSSSFHDFLRAHAPEVLPSGRRLPSGASIDAPHGTTIVAITFDGGVLMAGDRRATMGNIIANREMEKVFAADEFSTVGIAGTAGLAIELVRLFQVELSTTRRSRAR